MFNHLKKINVFSRPKLQSPRMMPNTLANAAPAPAPAPAQPVYMTREELTALFQSMEMRIMISVHNSVQHQFDEVNAARTDLIRTLSDMQRQMDIIRNAVRTLENRCDGNTLLNGQCTVSAFCGH
jgi:hypothetical protein